MELDAFRIADICRKVDVECEAFYGLDVFGKVISYSLSILKKTPSLSDEVMERVQRIKKPLNVVIISSRFDGMIDKVKYMRKKGVVINLVIFLGRLEKTEREKLRMYGISAMLLQGL